MRLAARNILNRSLTNSTPECASPLKVLTKQTPHRGEIMVFESPCTLYRDPRNNNFSEQAQPRMMVDTSEEAKGCKVYLPKDQVTTQHVKHRDSG